ncbi:MAG: hypothetical protein IKS41_00995 [Alphaproteobacteria bacterium]|nr:hypothetical protein [Alphaproteobacteria bacterium]
MTDKILTSNDFKTAEVFDCGLDNRDPQRGYRKSRFFDNMALEHAMEEKQNKDLAASVQTKLDGMNR